ncbi:hypothetical protein MmiEs2_10930 [Methanimicrococcus stummii]|uniref:Uncharacterized protein n=1 Tax=Methanimicrococcus stummii TaxID=3028294 RepID=A0AA96ZXC5_9EURY|nr:hypothetical protein [Methanimicrococcus sp. Es2]WNY28880.1 hypothetical protein MmiEs2_10930 [Methanimicrococcus sp. Es2]
MFSNLFDDCPVSVIRDISLFHGTSRENIDKIVSEGFKSSSSEDNYLGAGVYFYDSEFFAIWWKFNSDSYLKGPIQKISVGVDLTDDELNELIAAFQAQYGVIVAEMTDVSYLDMDNFKVKEMFNEVYENLYDICNTDKIFYTTVYDYLFEKMNFQDKYDMVVLTANLYKLTNKPNFRNKAPQALIPYRIYCLKNYEKIKTVSEYVINKKHMDTFIRFVTLRKTPSW